MPGSEQAVVAANEAFYLAFRARDVDAMERVWAERAPVACVHPGWEPLVGRASVMRSWRAILPGAPQIACQMLSAHVLGGSAFVICLEELPGAVLLATNVFVLEDDAWRLVHHHASLTERGPGPSPGGGPGPGQGPGGGTGQGQGQGQGQGPGGGMVN